MSIDTLHYLNVVLGLGAIALQIFSVLILFVFFGGHRKNIFLDFIEKHFLVIGFLISFFATLFSLVYSETIHFPPCELCWFQRVFLFPQVFIFGAALWEKNKKIMKYTLPLLFVGFIISIYQNLVYYFGESSNVPCDASGISCYKHLVSEFGGYISIPMLSLTSFLVLIVLVLVVYFYGKRNSIDL
ncbi:MAG: disulfide bond formation protein B [Candidatus Paceibacterota bacterium]